MDTLKTEVPIILKPPFTLETALAKVKRAEDAWNTRNPEKVAMAYSEDSQWRNRGELFTGRKRSNPSYAETGVLNKSIDS